MMNIKSEFALLDVLEPEASDLEKHLKANEKMPITIQGFIIETWSNHDGKSREYMIDVTSVTCEEANQ